VLQFPFTTIKQEDLQRTISPTFLTPFNNTASVALFNYGKLRELAFITVSPTMITVVKQWVQLCCAV
jgi:hypothetical protein